MPETNQSAIQIRGLRKTYPGRRKVPPTMVLDGVDLDVAPGSVTALLGPNGAGKTTIINILSTLLDFDAGEATLAGHDLRADPAGVRRVIGVTGQFSAVDDLLTPLENLALVSSLHHLPAKQSRQVSLELLDEFDLGDAAGRPVSTMSGAMKRKLDLAMTLVASPSIIFLDEPTTGLDPRSRRTMWQQIRRLVSTRGVTMLLTTQYLDEADELADQIAILDRGQIIERGTPAELKARVADSRVRLAFPTAAARDAALTALPTTARPSGGVTLDLPCPTSDPAGMRTVLDQLTAAGIHDASLTIHQTDLDDVFLTLTGKDGRTEQSA